jgi:hypothetical protein
MRFLSRLLRSLSRPARNRWLREHPRMAHRLRARHGAGVAGGGEVSAARYWPAGDFLIGMPNGPTSVSGYVYLGLGLHQTYAGSPKGRNKPRWALTHLGSGHLVGTLKGDVRTAFPVATEIAELGDWTFEGLTGWKNQFPDIQERVAEVQARHSGVFTKSGGRGASEDVARAIAMSA